MLSADWSLRVKAPAATEAIGNVLLLDAELVTFTFWRATQRSVTKLPPSPRTIVSGFVLANEICVEGPVFGVIMSLAPVSK
jgi:hypothetical protein